MYKYRTVNNINHLNKLYYCYPSNKMTGRELCKIVKNRRVNLDFNPENGNMLEVCIHKEKWKVHHKTWSEISNILNELCAQEDLREKIKDMSEDTYIINIQTKPLVDLEDDNDIETLLM